MLVANMNHWECLLEQHEDYVLLDEDFEEFDFWSRQVFYFENWWHNNPNSRVELIVYNTPIRVI